jgi:hypothetical protein
VHSNIGGGSSLARFRKDGEALFRIEPLADEPLAWMIDLCSPFLSFDVTRLLYLAENIQKDREEALTSKDSKESYARKGQYASTVFEDSYDWPHTPAGSIRRAPGQYDQTNQLGDGQHVSGFNDTCEYMHVSVRYRYQNMGEDWGWNRGQLSRWERAKKFLTWSDDDPLFKLELEEKPDRIRPHSSGYVWIKTLKNGSEVVIPEMRLSSAGSVFIERSLEERLIPSEVLKKIKAGEESLLSVMASH